MDNDDLPEQSEDATLIAWELFMLSELGFSAGQSETLIASGTSWHQAQALLDAGCTRQLAALILA